MHLTAFDKKQLLLLGKISAACGEGTICVSLTNPIQNADFEVLIKGLKLYTMIVFIMLY
jgi:hypothetical protein